MLRRRFGARADALVAELDRLERLRYGPGAGSMPPDWRGVRAAARALAAALAQRVRTGDATPARASP
jgi:hypothetical protein